MQRYASLNVPAVLDGIKIAIAVVVYILIPVLFIRRQYVNAEAAAEAFEVRRAELNKGRVSS